MGKGPVLAIGRENHPVLLARLRGVAKAKKIRVQTETFLTTGGTDALVIYKSHGGIPTQLIGVPNRYMHTTVEMLDLNDLENTSKLIAAFLLDVKKHERFHVRL